MAPTIATRRIIRPKKADMRWRVVITRHEYAIHRAAS
jgi:hypothetical protein